MEQREIILEQMLKVLKDIETNTCDKEFVPNTVILDKKLDRIIELHLEEIALLKKFTAGRCTCGKHSDKHKKEGKKSKKGNKGKKEREE
jgi:hypothetical protein